MQRRRREESCVTSGVIKKNERVVCVLTGHVLKDSDAAVAHIDGAPDVRAPIEIDPTLGAVERALA